MSPVLPFDIIVVIIDIVGENTNLLKELAMVSHSFHQICSKHLFATVELHDAIPNSSYLTSSKKGFVKLLESRPDVVKYIRKLTYRIESNYFRSSRCRERATHPSFNNDDDLLSPIFPNFLRTIPRLNCLTITTSKMLLLDWNTLDSSLTSAFLHLIHLPTINHIDLSHICNFPLSSFTPSANLHRLDIFYMGPFHVPREDDSFEIVQSAVTPKIREFHTSGSSQLTTKLLHAIRQDGRPAFNFMDLRRLSIPFISSVDEQNIRYLLPKVKLLEELHLCVGDDRSLVELHDIQVLSRTLKVLDLTVSLYHGSSIFLGGLCEELEALAGHNMLEALSFKVRVDGLETEDFIGSIIQKVEKVLVKPGWSALRQVSFTFLLDPRQTLTRWEVDTGSAKLSDALQSLPDKYLSHLSKLESIQLKFSSDLRLT
jgi:hypothetical protein